jgi:CO/xanthine dehydrogenase FAD-binding subunit
MGKFEYHIADSWDTAVALLQEYGDDAKPLAGGTNLMIQLAQAEITVPHIISLTRIPGWDTVAVNGDITLGAGVTYRVVRGIAALQAQQRALPESARWVGNAQVRNVGTIVGNLCNASPAADSVPPLLVMDATLSLIGPDGERTLPVEDFILGPGQTALQDAELVRAITLAALPTRTSTKFLKASRRQVMAVSSVSVAGRLTLADDGTCATARIALGAVATIPRRIVAAEQALEGRVLTPDDLQSAADLAAAEITPVSDVRASADYRRHLTRTMVRRVLEDCLEQLL